MHRPITTTIRNSGGSRNYRGDSANPQGGGANLLFGQKFSGNSMKIKEFGLRRGRRVPGAPPSLDPPMRNILVSNFWTVSYKLVATDRHIFTIHVYALVIISVGSVCLSIETLKLRNSPRVHRRILIKFRLDSSIKVNGSRLGSKSQIFYLIYENHRKLWNFLSNLHVDTMCLSPITEISHLQWRRIQNFWDRGANPLFGNISPKSCMKMKEIGPREGRVSLVPPWIPQWFTLRESSKNTRYFEDVRKYFFAFYNGLSMRILFWSFYSNQYIYIYCVTCVTLK